MNTSVHSRFVIRALSSILLAYGACSADREDHPDRHNPCAANQEKLDGFCVPKRPDAGGTNELDAGAGDDDSGSGLDASMPESCSKAGDVELCYEYPDQATALQKPCAPGQRTCGSDGFWSECIGDRVPETEGCDGVDNDCDSLIDEAQFQRTCEVTNSGVEGACRFDGLGVCRSGNEDCLQSITPVAEKCNGVDDDCDGTTDEGLDVACYRPNTAGCSSNASGGYDCVPASTCAPGKLRCVGGQMETQCTGDVRPTAELRTIAGQTPLDEDCDGMIDEQFDCQDGEQFPCYTGPGSTRGRSPCRDGTQLCTATGFGACIGEVTPEAETCANEDRDDDCNGTKDDVPRRGMSCSGASTAQGLCRANATWQCQSGTEVCAPGASSAEICDGRNEDESCDGRVDEGFDTQTDENNCGTCGTRCSSGQTCCGGVCVNTATSNTHCGSCSSACTAGLTCCSSSCVNTRTNVNHCGMCGKTCLVGLFGCNNGGCL